MVTAGIYVFDINIRSTVGDHRTVPGSFLLRKLDTLQVAKFLDWILQFLVRGARIFES